MLIRVLCETDVMFNVSDHRLFDSEHMASSYKSFCGIMEKKETNSHPLVVFSADRQRKFQVVGACFC